MSKNSDRTSMITIDWKPDRMSQIPIYSQIVSYFSDKISRGDWTSGQLVPSQRWMSEYFGVNRSTIVEAMNELASLGMVGGRFGGGTRITNDAWDLMMRSKAPNWKTYFRESSFFSNLPVVQIINRLEFDSRFVRLGTGELSPEVLPGDLVQTVLRKMSEKRPFINYPDQMGLPRLRQVVSEHLKRYGIEIPPSCILIVSGALQALHLVSAGLISSKSTLYVESPSYITSLNLFQSGGVRLEKVSMDQCGLIPWLMKAGDRGLRKSMLYTIPTFQNPTGFVMPLYRRIELLNYCREYRIPLIEDDVLRDMWLDAPPPPPVKSMDEQGSVLYIGSISKIFAPGMRIGWVAGSESVIRRLADVKMQMDYGVSSLAQEVSCELLESGLYSQGTASVRERLRERRDWMLELLEKYFSPYADWKRPAGGFFVWVHLKKRVSADWLFEEALKQKILLNPGSIYDSRFVSCLRISFGYLSKQEMEEALKILAGILYRAERKKEAGQ